MKYITLILAILLISSASAMQISYSNVTWEFTSEKTIPFYEDGFTQDMYEVDCDLLIFATADTLKNKTISKKFEITSSGLDLKKNYTITIMGRSSSMLPSSATSVHTYLDGRLVDSISTNAKYSEERTITKLTFPDRYLGTGDFRIEVKFSDDVVNPSKSEFEVRISDDTKHCGMESIPEATRTLILWLAAIFVILFVCLIVYLVKFRGGEIDI